MIRRKKKKTGEKYIDAFQIRLLSKNFILLKGRKGYIMCGYLDLAAAEKFGDAAVRITGVSTIAQALKATVSSCTTHAKKLGIKKGQPVKEVLHLLV